MEMEEAAAEEAGVRKRKRGGGGKEEEELEGGVFQKSLLAEEDEEGEGCYEGIAEEAVEEVMRWLEAEISPADAGFVTINGNEESCGPSFSAAASTVMASVDTRAGAPPPPPVPWPWPPGLPDGAAHKHDEADDVEMGEAAADDEEEWLAQLLTCGPALEVEGARF